MSELEKYKEAVAVAYKALEKYADSSKWVSQEHESCYHCNCPLLRDVFLIDWENGDRVAQDAISEIDEIFGGLPDW